MAVPGPGSFIFRTTGLDSDEGLFTACALGNRWIFRTTNDAGDVMVWAAVDIGLGSYESLVFNAGIGLMPPPLILRPSLDWFCVFPNAYVQYDPTPAELGQIIAYSTRIASWAQNGLRGGHTVLQSLSAPVANLRPLDQALMANALGDVSVPAALVGAAAVAAAAAGAAAAPGRVAGGLGAGLLCLKNNSKDRKVLALRATKVDTFKLRTKGKLMIFAQPLLGAPSAIFLEGHYSRLLMSHLSELKALRAVNVSQWVEKFSDLADLRDTREALTLVFAMDAVNRKEVPRALGILSQRMPSAVPQNLKVAMAKGGWWNPAETLELIINASSSFVPCGPPARSSCAALEVVASLVELP